jgi:hypothetical protein
MSHASFAAHLVRTAAFAYPVECIVARATGAADCIVAFPVDSIVIQLVGSTAGQVADSTADTTPAQEADSIVARLPADSMAAQLVDSTVVRLVAGTSPHTVYRGKKTIDSADNTAEEVDRIHRPADFASGAGSIQQLEESSKD